jgi:ABC-type molybdate transport system substrate-binding protein
MRLVILLTIGLLLCSAGCSKAPPEKTITIINAAAVDAPLLERIRAFAERELHVPVRTLENPKLAGTKDFQTLEKAARRVKTEADVTLIVLAGFNHEPKHLAVFSERGIALINTQALYTDEAEAFARRIERQVMRAAAFSFGLTPTPDPFCVTRDYMSLDDLDSMGRNFSPPWQGRFAEEAAVRGLLPENEGNTVRTPGL